jgi:hypothetical protein
LPPRLRPGREHPIHEVLYIRLGDGLELAVAETFTRRAEGIAVGHFGGLTSAPRRTDEVFVEVLIHGDIGRLDEGAFVRLVAYARQFGPRFPQLVEGAGELLSLAIVDADVDDEAIPDRPVFQLDLADWFYHWLIASFTCWLR